LEDGELDEDGEFEDGQSCDGRGNPADGVSDTGDSDNGELEDGVSVLNSVVPSECSDSRMTTASPLYATKSLMLGSSGTSPGG